MGVADEIPVAAPVGLDGIIATFGDPQVHPVGRDFDVDRIWERRNMTVLAHGFIPNARQEIYCHRLFAPLLARLLDAWAARVRAGDQYQLRTLACFYPRLQRGAAPGSQLYSTHSWGIAIDANADTNPLIVCPPDDPRRHHVSQGGARDIPDAWLDDARKLGLFCGIDFQHRSDPQHIQACRGY